MASTSTTETRMRDKRDTVPLLLESFPVPPSFIPPSPLLSGSPGSPLPPAHSPFVSPIPSPATRQPLSGPPSSPLPPVPGPSPITEHETLMFITAARSRRSSKMSLASTSSRYSQRDSVLTVASIGSGSSMPSPSTSMPSLSPSTSVTPYDSSRSLRSYPSTSSLGVPIPRYNIDRSPVIQPRIAEEDAADLTRMSLDEISLNSPLPDHLSDDEKVLDVGIAPSLSRQARLEPDGEPEPRTSFSFIEARQGHTRPEEDRAGPSAGPSATPRPRHSAPSSSSRVPWPAEKELPPLPPSQPPPRFPPPPPPPAQRRTNSPDIDEILATTPRPGRKSSVGSGLRSRSTSRSVRSLKRRVSEGVPEAASRRTSAASTSQVRLARARSRPEREEASELAYEQTAMASSAAHAHDGEVWDEDSFVSDYGVPIDQTGTPYEMFDGDEEARLEKELDGDGSDSDSSLDLHTPLPDLMVKDGLLSPNSKLVQGSRGTTPLPGDRPGSVFSVASTVGSVMTKSGLFKDERDTVKRRVRHRDGRLLAGGIGLTTGLGWSDSEDEDAPSPLIRQISSRSLKKRAASSSSLRNTSNSLSHSYSGHTPTSRMDEFGVLPKVPRSLPPTSWQKPRSMPGRGNDWRTSTSSSVSSASSASALSRTQSRASVTSHRSAPAGSTTRRGQEPTPLSMHALGYIHEGDEVGFNTPSTSSSASLPMPITPDDLPVRGRAGSMGKKVPARLDLAGAPDMTPDVYLLTSATPSTTSAPSPALSSFSSASTPRPGVPRPLRLPQSAGNLRRATDPSGSTRVPHSASASTPSVQRASLGSSGSLRQKPSLGSLRPPSAMRPVQTGIMSAPPQDGVPFPFSGPARSPSRSGPVARSSSAGAGGATTPKLKPRTGTGMVYRTAGSSPASPVPPVAARALSGGGSAVPAGRPSMLRMPSTTSLRSAKGVGIAL
ncbi:hypothetical protein VTO73DRAFT_3928 [Trametes versicolor]